jgi:superoxide dismutase, Fe-Mn family
MDFKKIDPKTFSENLFAMSGISKKTTEEHLKLYQGYVNKYNEVSTALAALSEEDWGKANQVFSQVRALKVDLSFAWGGVVNHELYFAHLGGKGGTPSEKLSNQITKDFGSFEAFKKELKATGIAARGWVWTAWNHREKRLINYLGDAQNSYPVWGATPIMALDTYEHAYFMDYGVNRGGYIDAFFENIDWAVVEKTFAEVAGGCMCGGHDGAQCKCNA